MYKLDTTVACFYHAEWANKMVREVLRVIQEEYDDVFVRIIFVFHLID